MKMFLQVCLVIFSISMSSSVVANETLRCGSKIVKTGMMMEEVRKFCGEPASPVPFWG